MLTASNFSDRSAALAGAVAGSDHVAVASLVALGADVNAEGLHDRVMLAPLYRAIRRNDLAMCEVLLGFGARFDQFGAQGQTALQLAVSEGNPDIVRLLVRPGAEVYAPERGGMRPLHRASDNFDLATVDVLLAAGVDIEATCPQGRTAFAWAAEAFNLDVCRHLLDAGAKCDAEANDGTTPLFVAVRQGRMDAVQFLVAAGASSSFIPEELSLSYLTPFQMAVKTGDVAIAALLAKSGSEDLAQRTLTGKTLVQLAANRTSMKELLRSLRTASAVSVSAAPENGAGACGPSTSAVMKRSNGPEAL
jgi:ankyrin repeat protein